MRPGLTSMALASMTGAAARGWSAALITLAICCFSCRLPAAPFSQTFAFAPSDPLRRSHVTIQGAVRLSVEAPDGKSLHGLSGIVWLPSTKLLYAVSDQGYLVWLKPIFDGSYLRDVEFVARFNLQDAKGNPLNGSARDAEGLAVFKAAPASIELLISFEQLPRIVRYSPEGKFLGEVQLPESLTRRLAHGHSNGGLEGLARWGDGFISGLEFSREFSSGIRSRMLELVTETGGVWQYPAAEEGGALVSLDTARDGQLVALERRYLSPREPLIISLRKIDLASEKPHITELARFSSAEGWAVDNFEAVAWHSENRFFLMSDDNAQPFQKTLLIHLSLPAWAENSRDLLFQ